MHTAIAVPLTARGVTLGVATFARAEHPEPYGQADMRLVSDLASRAAVHIDNARLYPREHQAAVTLQRSLLPRDIPPVPGLQIAHRYQPASRAAQVGGDWFDVIPLDAGQVALVVGDVTGHSIHAAALMGQLRTTTAALARLGCPPEQIMAQLSDLVAGHGDEIGATCLYAAYDPASRRCRLTSAGHLPPALLRPGGTTEFLDVPGGVMLGVGQGRYPAADTDLPPGSVLALYTDGLIEQPGQDIGTGMSRLARALAAGPARSLDQLCDSVLASPGPHPRDDIALLLARTTARPPADRRTAAPLPAARRILLARRSPGWPSTACGSLKPRGPRSRVRDHRLVPGVSADHSIAESATLDRAGIRRHDETTSPAPAGKWRAGFSAGPPAVRLRRWHQGRAGVTRRGTPPGDVRADGHPDHRGGARRGSRRVP